MKRRISFISGSMLSCAIALWMLSACTENTKSPTNGSTGGGNGDDTGTDDTTSDDDDGGSAGDLCDDGVKKAGLPDSFGALVDAFCDEYSSAIESSSIVYGKADYAADDADADKKKILVKNQKPEGEGELSYLMFASNDLETSAEDYFKLNKLRNNKPDVYKDAGFEVNDDTKVCNVEPGESATEFEALNDAETDIVHYTARTKYKKVSAGMYIISTELLDNFDETLRDLRTFSVIVAKGDKKAAVFTAAYQVAFKNSQTDNVILNKARNNLREEMRRNFANAKKANQVSDLEDQSSSPATSCE